MSLGATKEKGLKHSACENDLDINFCQSKLRTGWPGTCNPSWAYQKTTDIFLVLVFIPSLLRLDWIGAVARFGSISLLPMLFQCLMLTPAGADTAVEK